MNKISSSWTLVNKIIYPVGYIIVCIGLLFYVVYVLATNPDDFMIWGFPSLILLFIMLISAFFTIKLFSEMVDEAYDEGSYLFFRKSEIEIKVNLQDIKYVDFQLRTVPVMKITTNIDTLLGKEIIFQVPSRYIPFRYIPFGINDITKDLADRVDQAKSNKI